MKTQSVRIIDGKRYNTETATQIAKWHNGLGHSDFRYIYETLYRTPKGQFFLVGEGGAMTSYAESCGTNCWSGGSEWMVFTDDEAFEWLQHRDETDRLEELFSDRLQDA